MSDQIVITISRSVVYNFLGKVVFLIILGGIIGYLVGQDQLDEASQWKRKTPAERKIQIQQKNHEYEKKLDDQPLPTLATMGITIAVFWLIFTLYELLGLGLSGVIRKIFSSLESANP